MEKYMELCEIIIAMIGEDLREVFKKEANEPAFLPQEIFENSGERAEAALKIATRRAHRVLTLAILKHREKEHGENNLDQQIATMQNMTEEEINLAVTHSWWKD